MVQHRKKPHILKKRGPEHGHREERLGFRVGSARPFPGQPPQPIWAPIAENHIFANNHWLTHWLTHYPPWLTHYPIPPLFFARDVSFRLDLIDLYV